MRRRDRFQIVMEIEINAHTADQDMADYDVEADVRDLVNLTLDPDMVPYDIKVETLHAERIIS